MKINIIVASLLVVFTLSSFSVIPKTEAIEPFFTLVGKTGDSVGADYLNFISQQLAKIGINLDVQVLDWPAFVGELLAFRDFDLCVLSLGGGGADPDFTGVYDENGSLNLFGYHTSMDYNETLGTGINEWYMKQGNLIMPPDSSERVQHYWAWEDYMMDKICPLKPMYAPQAYIAHWSNLNGYNYSDGLKQSWGKMSFVGSHDGQVDTTEFVTSDVAWSDLNPLFSDDGSSSAIYGKALDPLIFYDADLSTWPHLATDWYHINETHLRVEIREDVKWQTDPDGLFTNEYLDARDVYFTYYAWKYVSNDKNLYDWIDEMKIVDDYTIDFYIDGDPSTPENEPYAPYITNLNTYILPEHYLNQTQLIDGVTPDISDITWNTFATSVFGTSILELASFVEGVETTMEVFDDCWLMNPDLADDPDLDWARRWGDVWELESWRQRIIPDVQTALLEFEAGKTDLEGCTVYPERRKAYEEDPDIDVQTDTIFSFIFCGYNMRENRPNIGDRSACPGDPSLSIGLAVRKAISYAIDRNQINDVMHSGEYTITDHPIHAKMGIWCNPNIIRYNHDLDLAREYMEIAGFSIPSSVETPGFVFWTTLSSLFAMVVTTIYLSKRRK